MSGRAEHAARSAAELRTWACGGRFAPDEEVQRNLDGALAGIDSVALAPLAGRTLDFLITDGRHDPVLDAAFAGLERYLGEHGNELRDRVGPESPWWLPGAVEDRIFERLLDAARAVLSAMAADPDHHLRRTLDQYLAKLADDLQHSPELAERGEQLKHELLNRPEVREWVGSLWLDLKGRIRDQIEDPASPLRDRLAEMLMDLGHRLATDPALRATVDHGPGRRGAFAAERFDGEIADLVSGTIARWDAAETSRRSSCCSAADLQFIRINGTVVGAAAGLALHAVAMAGRMQSWPNWARLRAPRRKGRAARGRGEGARARYPPPI